MHNSNSFAVNLQSIVGMSGMRALIGSLLCMHEQGLTYKVPSECLG